MYEILIVLIMVALFNRKLFAVGLFDGMGNGNVFEAWMKQCLLPQCSPNNVIIMDNVAFHKRETARLLIEQVGHEILWLPPYSPDLNPIEKKWAEIKNKWKNTRLIVLIRFLNGMGLTNVWLYR